MKGLQVGRSWQSRCNYKKLHMNFSLHFCITFHKQGSLMWWRFCFLGLMLKFGWVNFLSVKGDNFYHVCIAKANTSPFMSLSLFYFVQSNCTSAFSSMTYWRNVVLEASEGIFVTGNGKTMVSYSEWNSTEQDLVKGHRKAQKCITFQFPPPPRKW